MISFLRFIDTIALIIISYRTLHAATDLPGFICIIAALVIGIIISSLSKSEKPFTSLIGWLFFDGINIVGLTYLLRIVTLYLPFYMGNTVTTTLALLISIATVIILEVNVIHPHMVIGLPADEASDKSDILARMISDVRREYASTKIKIMTNSGVFPEGIADSMMFDLTEMQHSIMESFDKYNSLISDKKSKRADIEQAYNSVVYNVDAFRRSSENDEKAVEARKVLKDSYGYEEKHSDQGIGMDEDIRQSSSEDFFRGCSGTDSIKTRYRSLCKIYHPDSGNGDEETFRIIQEQYNSLITRP